MKKLTPIILIIAAFIIGYCSRPTPTEHILIRSDTIYQDTGSHSVTIIPRPYAVHDTAYIDTATIDTAAILADYFKVRQYDSTIVNDSSLYIRFRAIVWRNEIMKSTFDFRSKRPTVVNHYEPIKTRFEFGVGAMISRTPSIFGTVKKGNWAGIIGYNGGLSIGGVYYFGVKNVTN